MTKNLETVANISIVLIALIAGAVLVRNYLLSNPELGVPVQIAVGEEFSLTDVDWRGNGNTLVFALAPGCDSCSESAPFYRRLIAELPAGRVHLTAVLPETAEEGRQYLRSLNIEIADVRQGSFQSLKIKGTPTLVLVDERGEVRNVWLGRIPPDKEQQVINSIREAVS